MALFSRKTKKTADVEAVPAKKATNKVVATKTGTKKATKSPKTTKAASKAVTVSNVVATSTYPTKHRFGSVILSPRITEKATAALANNNVYVFNIHKDATKPIVAKAIHEIYQVDPIKVTIAKTPAKRVFIRGKRGVKSGTTKAYVFLKEGDKIEFV